MFLFDKNLVLYCKSNKKASFVLCSFLKHVGSSEPFENKKTEDEIFKFNYRKPKNLVFEYVNRRFRSLCQRTELIRRDLRELILR